MNSSGNPRVREVFATALEQAPEARGSYLAEACGIDGELRALVESLLEAHDRSASFMPAFEPGAAEDFETIGTEIGSYRLLEQIGEGGFGVVYRAEQVTPVRRQVALKIVKAGMDTKEVIARFEAERQALALMDHPNIARILEAGTTDKGRPYFVMELVEGVPITEFCDQHRLRTEDRLKLFSQVCHAVQHAHQKGIIHRDLKPTNILVTGQEGEPMPKVIDFGVAKALGVRLTEKTLHTHYEQLIGTPAYMSPEQADLSSLDVDTRADIYSLGVLLYELLTGTTPFEKERLKQAALDEVRRLIRETEPPKPSIRLHTVGNQITEIAQRRQTEPATLNKLVRGDLDWIAMKALAKEPQRRYDTAAALALDLERHLHHEPILARPPSATYRVCKFVRRHRIGVLAGSSVLLALCAGLAAALIGYVQVRKERDRARQAEEHAELAADMTRAVNDFLLKDLLQQASPGANPDRNLTLRAALDRAAEQVGERFKTNAALEAVVRRTLGNTFRALGEYAAAERHLRRAYEIRRQELGPDEESTVHAQIDFTLALIEQAQTDRTKVAESETILKEALETSQRVLGPEHRDTLSILNNLGLACAESKRYVQAARIFERVLEVQRRATNYTPATGLTERENLAATYLKLGRTADAESLQREALEAERRLHGADHPDNLLALDNLACCLMGQGRYADAQTLFDELLERRQRVLGAQHPLSITTVRLLALVHAALADWDTALKYYRKLIDLEPANFDNWYRAPVAAWLARDTNACHALLSGLVDRFGKTSHLDMGKALALDCLLLADFAPTLEPALHFAALAAEENPNWPHNRTVKALAECRQGHWTEAARWADPWRHHYQTVVACSATYLFAMAQHQLGETAAAQAELERANRRLATFLRGGDLPSDPEQSLYWDDYGRLVMLRSEAESLIARRPLSAPLDTVRLAEARARSEPAHRALETGNRAAGAGQWPAARDAFVAALQHPNFEWDVLTERDPEVVVKIGLTFILTADWARHEQLCRALLDRFRPTADRESMALNPLVAGGASLVCLLKEKDALPELQRQVLELAQALDIQQPDGSVRAWLRLIIGLGHYRLGEVAEAMNALDAAEQAASPVCRGPAQVYRALTLSKLGRPQEADALLVEAEHLLSPLIEERTVDWRYWQNLELARLALDEAHRQMHRPDRR